MARLLSLLIISFFLASCADRTPPLISKIDQAPSEANSPIEVIIPEDSEPVAEETPILKIITARWEIEDSTTRKWTQFIYDNFMVIGKNLVATIPTDIELFCPNYINLNKHDQKNFWIYLLSAMSHYESHHNPELEYKESFRDSRGKRIISRGLLQLSHESSLGYDCPLTKLKIYMTHISTYFVD